MSKQQGAGADGEGGGAGGWEHTEFGHPPAPLAQNHYVIKVAITAGKAKIEN